MYVKGKPISDRCGSCSQKARTRSYDIEQLKRDGIKCKYCGNIFPATTEYFSPEQKNRIGLKFICKKCRSKRNREHNLKIGKTKLTWEEYIEREKQEGREKSSRSTFTNVTK